MRRLEVDPRVSLLLAIGSSILLACVRSWPALGVGLASGIVLLLVSRPAGTWVWSRFWRLQLLLGLFFVLLPLSWIEGGWSWDSQRWVLPAQIFLRANAMFCWVMALVVPMGSRGLLRAMQGLGLPRSMVQMSTLSIRYLSLMQSELRQMKLAMASRGYRNRWSLETYHVWAMIMGMLFLRSLDRSENLRRSMAARNVGLFVPMPHPPLSLVDIGAALAGLVLVGVVLTLEFSSLYGGWG